MKATNIIGILVIAASIFVLVSAAGDMSTYASFADAIAAPNQDLKIAGILSKDKPMTYNPQEDPNYFSFYIKDDAGIEKEVVFKGAKPQDFDRSEQIVLTGKMTENGEQFIASDMLMKCPSKYKDEEIQVKATI